MSIVMFIVGALTLLAGAGMVAWGIPINEFSFGNTLIVSGTFAIVGGLILVALGTLASQLKNMADVLNAQRAGAPRAAADLAEAPVLARTAGVTRPSLPRSDLKPPGPASEPPSADNEPPTLRSKPKFGASEEEAAPRLSNPELTAEAAPDFAAALKTTRPAAAPDLVPPMKPPAPSAPRPQSAPPRTFEAMWPPASAPKSPPVKEPPGEPKPEPAPEPRPERAPRVEPPPPGPEPAPPRQSDGNELRAVAILKSGVVDGMGYTLYVDGSIEAELPQGTLRFTSINDLRSYLEKNQ